MGLDTNWIDPAASKKNQNQAQHNRHIIVKLWGGLGNQMFQYAFGLPLKADVSYFQNQPSIDTPRHYELDSFMLQLDFATNAELPRKKKTLGEKLLLLMGGDLPMRKLSERHYYSFDAELLNGIGSKQSLYLDGYWQCPEYFEDIRDELLQKFKLRKPLSAEQKAEAELINKHTSIGLHVRRGDFISNPNAAKVHNLCPMEYYAQAIGYIAQRVPEAHFMVFSDDVPWCRQELHIPYEHSFVKYEPDTPAFGIHLMSLCKHHIIANSSYSWWGAWLAEPSEQIVIAPKQWLQPQHPHNTAEGLIPAAWIRM